MKNKEKKEFPNSFVKYYKIPENCQKNQVCKYGGLKVELETFANTTTNVISIFIAFNIIMLLVGVSCLLLNNKEHLLMVAGAVITSIAFIFMWAFLVLFFYIQKKYYRQEYINTVFDPDYVELKDNYEREQYCLSQELHRLENLPLSKLTLKDRARYEEIKKGMKQWKI